MSYEYVTSADRLPHIAREIERTKCIGFDIETTAYEPYDIDKRGVTAEIRLLSVNTGLGIYVVDLFQTGGLGPVLTALAREDVIKIVQNAKFEQKWFLYKYDVELWPVFDTYRASVLIHNGYDKDHHLWALFERELGITPRTKEELGGSDWTNPRLTQQQIDYSAEDVENLPAMRESLKAQLQRKGLLKVALIEFGAILPEAAVELNGLFLDTDDWLALAEENQVRSIELRNQLIWKLPNPSQQIALPGITPGINLDSPPQMLASLRKLGGRLEDLENTREITLAMYAAEFPVIQEILEYREFSKKVSQFGSKYLEHIHAVTGRIHPSYFPFTGAGRYACSNPNVQQIPRGKAFRACFKAPPGRRIVVADYSNIEMRLCAEITGDRRLIEIFNSDDDDAHRATAALMAGCSKEEVSKAQRQEAKPVNFGLIYGMQAPKLVLYAMANYGVALTLKRAKQYREKFFDSDGYYGVAKWHETTINDVKPRGYTRTLSGRIRYLKEDAHNEFFNCLDEKTEALTKRGWVKGFDLKDDDVLLTKNAETGELEWARPTEVKKWPSYYGELVEFASRSFSAVSTPNHRWLVTNKATGKDECRVTDAISDHGDHRIHRTGNYAGQDEAVYSDDFVELVGWFLTDGSLFPVNSRGGRPKVTITQSERANPAKVEEIDALMSRLGWGHSRTVWRETQQVTWHLQKLESGNLAELFPDRRLTIDFLLGLTSSQLDLLYHTMIKGDGHVEDSGKETFCSGSLEGAEMFQVLCVLLGKAATLHERDMSRYAPRSDKLSNVPRMGIVYYVNVLKRDKVQVTAEQKRRFRVNGEQGVWCPIVPNTYFVARREGHVYVTGNTPVQGSGADGLKAALRAVYMRLKKQFGGWRGAVKMVHHVHDEIILDTEDNAEVDFLARRELCEGMREGMEQFVTKVPVKVEPESGDSWGTAKT